jgi:hypothetical protein
MSRPVLYPAADPATHEEKQHMKLSLVALALGAIVLGAVAYNPTKADAQAGPTGTFSCPLADGSNPSAVCTVAVTGFRVVQGTLSAVGTITSPTGQTQNFTAPVTITQASCTILHLEIGPINLDLLGLVLTTNRIVIDLSAQPGPGNLLGNLLCSIANLLNQNQTQGVARVLNQLLGALRITGISFV